MIFGQKSPECLELIVRRFFWKFALSDKLHARNKKESSVTFLFVDFDATIVKPEMMNFMNLLKMPSKMRKKYFRFFQNAEIVFPFFQKTEMV